MKISRKLAESIHILLAIDMFKNDYKITSEFLASSLNINPVLVRQLLVWLNNANITKIVDRKKGIDIVRNLSDLTMYDVYKAVDCDEENLFGFHPNPNVKCPVGSRIHSVLDGRFKELQDKFEDSLKTIYISDIANDLSILSNNI